MTASRSAPATRHQAPPRDGLGRTARIARENRETELAAGLRIVMDVLRAHAKPRPTRGR